ncbi:PIG-L deacetylase family protein [Halomonas sp. PAMB 3232]|uniref:PIG-L deacetylase family protein n=1 Tax=Halomonas sp. PAMB 3232 TaxID=3075221 RepID=UPI00289A14EA|nr:PIG-L deacetylase family protein [Halomonas sp. PAMB 3232]WNL40130.1 PIG-L deacetylase family protein [Halomonas sp. PAMB 3232]
MREAWYVPYTPTPLEGSRVLVLAPHPDDEVFGCGGALAQLAARGAEIRVVIATQGPQAALRLAESTRAAAVLGYPAPINWAFPDRGLEQAIDALADTLLEALEAFTPDLLLAPSSFEMHPDHRAACDAALKAGERFVAKHNASLSIALYEIGVPLSANQLVDISQEGELKARAMQCFASQLAEQRYADQIDGLNRYRSYTLGLSVTRAEAFHVLAAGERGDIELPSVQDQALWRCEAALARTQAQLQSQAQALGQMQAEHVHAIEALKRENAALVDQAHEDRQALAQSEQAKRGAEQELQAIYATRGWRWLSRLKSLLGRG